MSEGPRTRTGKALCVLRMRPGTGEFDTSFFLDLKLALQSPGFYAAHPMKDGKLLVNVWAPDVAVDSVATPDDPNWCRRTARIQARTCTG